MSNRIKKIECHLIKIPHGNGRKVYNLNCSDKFFVNADSKMYMGHRLYLYVYGT